MEKIFIAGATGFVGSNLIRRLVEEEKEVTAFIMKRRPLVVPPGGRGIVSVDDVVEGHLLAMVPCQLNKGMITQIKD